MDIFDTIIAEDNDDICLSDIDIDQRDDGGYTLLHTAIMHERYNIVKTLLNHSANTYIRTRDRMGPLTLSIKYQYLDIARVLLQYSLSKNDKMYELGIAIGKGYTSSVKLLLQHGVDPNIHNEGKLHPLMIAIINNHTDIVKLLLNDCAKIEYVLEYPIDNLDIIRYLAIYGAK